jgi:hypothetical protein
VIGAFGGSSIPGVSKADIGPVFPNDAPAGAPPTIEALAELSEHATFTRVLGTYQSARTR